MNTTIFIGIVCALCAGLAQALAHQVAAIHAWKRIPRYEADKTRRTNTPSRDDLEKWANAIAGEHDDAA